MNQHKRYFFAALLISLFSCRNSHENRHALEARIDSLEKRIEESYKPGFGEFMSGIQAHHAKLWFAGQNENWKLADFEVHEIMEAIGDIQKFQQDRPESKMVGTIQPALDSISSAIQSENPVLFKRHFVALTAACNACHHAAHYEFNVVKIPEVSTFSNQEFSLKKALKP